MATIVLVAVNLRPVISSVPPLVDTLAATLGLSSVAAGALTTLPVVCMGLFAPVASLVARRRGSAPVLATAVALIGFGAVLRGFLGVAGIYAGTALAGVGIAIAGTLLPTLVRARTPDRVGPITGIYTATLISGALVSAGASEPLRALLGWSAQQALILWAIPTVPALLLIVFTHRGMPRPTNGIADISASPWRSGPAWWGTLFMGAQSLLFYTALAWLAADYISLGMAATNAGFLLALFSATQVISALAMPVLSHRFGRIRLWITVSVGITTIGLALIAFLPEASPWAWVALTGLGMGGNLSLALTVVTQSAPTPQAAASYTGMAFFVGYLLAAVGPVAAGALHDLTGTYTSIFTALTALGLATILSGLAATRT